MSSSVGTHLGQMHKSSFWAGFSAVNGNKLVWNFYKSAHFRNQTFQDLDNPVDYQRIFWVTLTVVKLQTADSSSVISKLTCSWRKVPFASLENLSTLSLFCIGKQIPLWVRLNISLIVLCIHLMCQGKNTAAPEGQIGCVKQSSSSFFFSWMILSKTYATYKTQDTKRVTSQVPEGWATAQNLDHFAPLPSTFPLPERKAAPKAAGLQPQLPSLPGEQRSGHDGGFPAPPESSPWSLQPSGRPGFSLCPPSTACAPRFGKCCLRICSLQCRQLCSALCLGMSDKPCTFSAVMKQQNKYSKLFLQN